MNLISLSFIAILAGLGDDQVVHFFNRVPQEWAKATTLNEAVMRTFETTGLSVVYCIVTAATATASLAFSSFKALAEFGFILTVGMFMMMIHTLLTVPALMGLWWKFSKPRAPETITFRFLPWIARKSVDFVGRHSPVRRRFRFGSVPAVVIVSADRQNLGTLRHQRRRQPGCCRAEQAFRTVRDRGQSECALDRGRPAGSAAQG